MLRNPAYHKHIPNIFDKILKPEIFICEWVLERHTDAFKIRQTEKIILYSINCLWNFQYVPRAISLPIEISVTTNVIARQVLYAKTGLETVPDVNVKMDGRDEAAPSEV